MIETYSSYKDSTSEEFDIECTTLICYDLQRLNIRLTLSEGDVELRMRMVQKVSLSR